jgi:isopenicillin-N epimerase
LLDKSLFLLDPEVIFLNHGSFGATPRPVFDVYQSWQRKLENQPVKFLGREAAGKLEIARQQLACYLHASPDQVVYFGNPTTAINMVARNLSLSRLYASQNNKFILREGDEVLVTNHEYGALIRTWHYICKQTGAIYREVNIPLPLESPVEFGDRFWSEVNERTRLIFISHITSPTALTFPIAEICQRARHEGIITVVDGAHAPGHISLNLPELGADIYTGACHKWLCAPKGSAFLYVRKEIQNELDPLVISWGYESENPSESRFIDYHEWQGTRDISSFLSVPSAIEFQEQHNWGEIRRESHMMAIETRRRIESLTGLPTICADNSFQQMFTARLPESIDLAYLKETLYDRYRIEVPTILWNGEKFIRVSFQAYNTQDDADFLLDALEELL